MHKRGVSPVLSSLLLIVIVVAVAAVVYSTVNPLSAVPQSQAPTILESLKIIQVSVEGNYLHIYVLNRGGIDVVVDAVYVETPSGELLVRQPVYYIVPAGETADIAFPKGGLDITRPLSFKLASQRGVLSSSLALVQRSIIPPAPSLFSFYPTTSTITIGSYVGGSLPSSVQYVDGSYFTIISSPSFTNPAYHPSSYTVQNGYYVNGSVSLLQLQDQQSMYFLSAPSSYINRTYNATSYAISNGSLASGSLPDTYAQDDNRMTFSSQTVSQNLYPITNMNFTTNAEGWSGYLSESVPELPEGSIVTEKSSRLVSANQRAVSRTSDPEKTIHVAYSNGTYLGYSISADGGKEFVDQWFISNGAGYESGCNVSILSDSENNLHITYQDSAISPRRIRYILATYNPSYGGNSRTSTAYQTINGSTLWAAHFIALNETLSTLQLYIMNVSTPYPVSVEIRRVLSSGAPDMSPSGLIGNTNLTNVPSTFSWVNASIEASLEKGKQYAVLLRTNGTYRWAHTNLSYAGSIGGWSYSAGSWNISPTTHFCFSIPGWFGWTFSAPTTIYSVTGTTIVGRPAIVLYPYLTKQDQGFYSSESSVSIFGNNYYAQSFTPSSQNLSGVMLYLYRIGSPAGHLYVEIRKSNGSYPDMSTSGVIASGRIDAGRVIDVTAGQWFDCIFTQPVNLNATQTYWIVLYSMYSTPTNRWIWYYSSAGGYPGGTAASSADGGNTWVIQTWDFSFRTYSSKEERPAIAWYYQAILGGSRQRIQFLRCLPNLDPTLASSWYNYAGTSRIPDTIYSSNRFTEARVSMTVQPNTNNIYFFIIESGNLYYNRIYRWNPTTGNWASIGYSTSIISGVSLTELSSAPEPYNNWAIFTAVSTSTYYTYVWYFDSSNALENITPPSTSMRYPSLMCIASRIYVFYQSSDGIYYRYYKGSWSSAYQYYGSSTSSLPNTIYRPTASSVDLVWLNGTSQILFGSLYPTGLLKIIGPTYDPSNGNPSGSGGGSLYFEADDGDFDYSFYRFNITYYTNFTSPPSWDSIQASFAWQFNLTSSFLTGYGSYAHVKLNSIRLILSDQSDSDLYILYTDDNDGNGWTGVSVGYLYRTGIQVTYPISPNTHYKVKVVFDVSCSEPSDLSHITARIDDVGLSFSISSSLLSVEFSGTSDTDDWSSIFINTVSNISEIPANFTLRVYNFALDRYPVYGEEGYFTFTLETHEEVYRSLQIASGAENFRNSSGEWLISMNITSYSDSFLFGVNMLNFVPQVNIHSISVEFSGTSDISEWESLLWMSTQAFSIPSVTVTIQLYNYTEGSYQTSGFGYLTYTSGPAFTYETSSQNTTINPEDFRDASGNWKLRITATKLGKQFYMLNDYILFSPTSISQQEIDAYFTFTDITAGTIINMTYNVTSLLSTGSVNVTFQIWDYSMSSWSTIYYVNYISSPVPNTPETITITVTSDFTRYISMGESRIRVYAFKDQPPSFNFSADQIVLNIWAV
ncbi:MAG: archaellin/type IV pilin N-terminal domain-containing protein [Candidatus Methanomethylicaceae archaeon]